MEKKLLFVFFSFGFFLGGCVTQSAQRKISSDSASESTSEVQKLNCLDHEIRSEDGRCVRRNEIPHPLRRGGY